MTTLAALILSAGVVLGLRAAKERLEHMSPGRAATSALVIALLGDVVFGLVQQLWPATFQSNSVAGYFLILVSVWQIAPWIGPVMSGEGRAGNVLAIAGAVMGLVLFIGVLLAVFAPQVLHGGTL